MWLTVLKWASILFPIVWRYVEPLLAKSQLNEDLKWILPFAERMVRAVENTWKHANTSSTGKATAAQSLIRAEMNMDDPKRVATVPTSTINLAIELALKRMTMDAANTPSNGIPASGATEQSGTQVSQP